MVSYKNITIKKKGGGTRKQRVKVLKSGKFKFVKNLRSKVSRKAKPKTRKRSVRRMARKKRRRSGKNWTGTAFKLIRVGALVAPGAVAAFNAHKRGWGAEGIADQVLQVYTGYSAYHNEFKWEYLAKGWIPYIVANLATHGIPKIVGLIRRL